MNSNIQPSRPAGFRILLVIPAIFGLLLMFSFTSPGKTNSSAFNFQTPQQKPVVQAPAPVKTTIKFTPPVIAKDEITVLNDAVLDAYYPGGHNAWWKFITSNFKFTKEITKANTSGEILLQFIVTEKGEVQEPKVILSLNKACNEEMERVFSMMPKWHPYLKGGKPVSVKYQIPIFLKVELAKGNKPLTTLLSLKPITQTKKY
jgi:hypothetical protein